MASGYFPLDRRDESGKRVLAAISEIDAVLDEYCGGFDPLFNDLTPEDAFNDGEYISDMRRAAAFLEGCLQKEQRPAPSPHEE